MNVLMDKLSLNNASRALEKIKNEGLSSIDWKEKLYLDNLFFAMFFWDGIFFLENSYKHEFNFLEKFPISGINIGEDKFMEIKERLRPELRGIRHLKENTHPYQPLRGSMSGYRSRSPISMDPYVTIGDNAKNAWGT